MRSIPHPLILLLLLFGCTIAHAQAPRILLGPYIGFGTGPERAALPVYRGSPDCGLFESGTASGLLAGARVQYPSLLSEQFGIGIAALWSRSSGSLTGTPIDPQMAIDPESGSLVTLEREFRLDSRRSLLQIDLFGTFAAAPGWLALAGASLGYQLDLSTRQVDSILGPGRSSFAGGERSRPMIQGEDPSPARFVPAVLVAIGYQLPAGNSVTLVPEIGARANLLSIVSGAGWKGVTIGAGLSLLFDATPSYSAVDTVIVRDSIPTPRLSASVRIDGLDESGNPVRVAGVRVSEIFHRRYTPLLPVVFFDPGSATIADRYLNAVAAPKRSFQIAHAADRDAVDLHRFNLDIIGRRLQEEPEATVELFGSSATGEEPALAASRIEAVREYLAGQWAIDRARIRTAEGDGPMRRSGETTRDGREENRRVAITASSPGILAPVRSEEVHREFNPPLIQMTPTMNADAGVRRWTMEVLQGGRPVAHYSSDDTSRTDAELEWRIAEDRIDSIPTPLAVELMVEDSTGAIVRAYDEMPVTVERTVDIVERHDNVDADRTTYSLVGFDYNAAEAGTIGRDLPGMIVGSLEHGARIRVIGYTDRIGDEASNRALSLRRAENVASTIRALLGQAPTGAVPITVEAGGADRGRFTNDLPEGRMLSRGVDVIIER